MKIGIHIGALVFDSETGLFKAHVAAIEVIPQYHEGSDTGMFREGVEQGAAEATGPTHTEAIRDAITKVLRDPVFHKGAA